jgi:hypothetical protein
MVSPTAAQQVALEIVRMEFSLFLTANNSVDRARLYFNDPGTCAFS